MWVLFARLTVTCEVPPTHSAIKLSVNDVVGVTSRTTVVGLSRSGLLTVSLPDVIWNAFCKLSVDVSVSMTRSLMNVNLIRVVPLGNTIGFWAGF